MNQDRPGRRAANVPIKRMHIRSRELSIRGTYREQQRWWRSLERTIRAGDDDPGCQSPWSRRTQITLASQESQAVELQTSGAGTLATTACRHRRGSIDVPI